MRYYDPLCLFTDIHPASYREQEFAVFIGNLRIEVVSVTSEYPQNGGWGALLLRLLHLHASKDCVMRNWLHNIRLGYMQNDYTHKMGAVGKKADNLYTHPLCTSSAHTITDNIP